MRRREFFALMGAAATWPFEACAQERGPLIGYLTTGALGSTPLSPAPVLEAFRQGLREQAYVDGENIRVDVRSAQGEIGQLPTLAMELVRLKVQVIVAVATPAARAARQATTTIPIVAANMGDPVVGFSCIAAGAIGREEISGGRSPASISATWAMDTGARLREWATFFHPSPWTLLMGGHGPTEYAAALTQIESSGSRKQRALARLLLAHERRNWNGLLTLARDGDVPFTDAKPREIRALGELGRLDEMVQTYQKAARRLPLGSRRECMLFVLAFTGRVERLQPLLDRPKSKAHAAP